MIYLIFLIFSVLAQSFFSGIETGLISVLKPRARRGVQKKESGAKDLLYFIERPGIMLATTLMGTNICVVISSNMAKKAANYFGLEFPEVNLFISAALAILLLNAEIIPKDWFRQFPYQRCRMLIPLFKVAYFVLFIPSNILSIYTTWINSIASSKKDGPKDTSIIIRKDLLLLLRESQKAGVVNQRIADIIDKTLYFQNLTVADFMQEKKSVIEIHYTASALEAFEKAKQFNLSRLPVTKNPDEDAKWSGVFSIYDLIFEKNQSEWHKIKVSDLIRPLNSISSNAPISELLEKAKLNPLPLMAVHDPKNPDKHIGIVSIFSITEKLFQF